MHISQRVLLCLRSCFSHPIVLKTGKLQGLLSMTIQDIEQFYISVTLNTSIQGLLKAQESSYCGLGLEYKCGLNNLQGLGVSM